MNFGYDNTQDVGSVSPGVVQLRRRNPSLGVTSLVDLTNIRYFMAADTADRHLDITGIPTSSRRVLPTPSSTDVLIDGDVDHPAVLRDRTASPSST